LDGLNPQNLESLALLTLTNLEDIEVLRNTPKLRRLIIQGTPKLTCFDIFEGREDLVIETAGRISRTFERGSGGIVRGCSWRPPASRSLDRTVRAVGVLTDESASAASGSRLPAAYAITRNVSAERDQWRMASLVQQRRPRTTSPRRCDAVVAPCSAAAVSPFVSTAAEYPMLEPFDAGS
jgi:hypothetical protein